MTLIQLVTRYANNACPTRLSKTFTCRRRCIYYVISKLFAEIQKPSTISQLAELFAFVYSVSFPLITHYRHLLFGARVLSEVLNVSVKLLLNMRWFIEYIMNPRGEMCHKYAECVNIQAELKNTEFFHTYVCNYASCSVSKYCFRRGAPRNSAVIFLTSDIKNW